LSGHFAAGKDRENRKGGREKKGSRGTEAMGENTPAPTPKINLWLLQYYTNHRYCAIYLFIITPDAEP